MHNFFLQYANAVGILGVSFVLLAYYLLNINKLHSTSLTYLLLNFSGSCFLLFSLLFYWNLSSVIIEIAWISISLIGIYRAVNLRKQRKQEENNVYALHKASDIFQQK